MKCVCFLTAYLLAYAALAQTVFFNNISQEEGLRNGNVRAIVKDYQGFIWIGTEDGLHRFDGYTMKIYSKVEGDSSTIGSNYIICLYEDSHHNLWVGTLDAGLYVYNRKTDSFTPFRLRTQSDSITRFTIRSIAQAKDSYLYVGTDNLFRSKIGDPDSMQFTQVPFLTDTIKRLTRFAAIEHDLDSNLLISVNSEGLFSYDLKSGKSYPHPMSEIAKDISSVYTDRHRNIIWAASWKNGIVVYDPINKRQRQINAGNNDQTIRSNFIAAVTGDALGNLWIAADNGLSMISHTVDPFKDLTITTYLPGNADNSRIHGNIMKSVYVDNNDKVWIGTNYEGVNLYDKNSMNFGSLNISTDFSSPFAYGNINAIEEDQMGNLWLGLDGDGLYKFEGSFNNAKHYTRVRMSENIDKIKTLKIDRDNLWIGTWGNGLLVFNFKTQSCRKIDTSSSGVNFNTEIMSLNTDGVGNLWIGTFDDGLFRYRMSDGHIVKVTGSNTDVNSIDRINAIYTDKKDNIWIGKDVGGLNFLKKGDSGYHTITTTHLNSSTTISSIIQDVEGIVWAGAPNLGLVRYDPISNTSELFNEEKGLINIAIHSIQEDTLKRLWISHNGGISVFEKGTKIFRNFGKRNGTTANQFNNNSSIVRADGQMVFGNIHGINFFTPTDFKASSEISPVVFTRFFVDNIEQPASSGVLDENIVIAQDVTLQHDKNSFSIEFAELSFTLTNQTQYAYMLENFDAGWQPAGTRRLISYTNLEPGVYTLKVKTSNSLSGQSNFRELKISIIPAWWQTRLFKLLVASGLVIAAIVVHRLRIRFLMRQKKLLEEQVNVRTLKLNETNRQLQARIEEIQSMNQMLQQQQLEIFEKNNEIQAQNEELQSQHEQIFSHQDSLLLAREELKEINANLERTVAERTNELKHTINDLNKTVFELDRFVYSASHDLSAPLKSIHGLVELIKLEPDPTKVLEYTNYIKTTVVKLEDVIKSMIDYARNTHMLVKLDDVNLKDIVDEVAMELAFWQEASKIRFINNVPENSQVQTDQSRLKVILHNLVSNSIKYRDPAKDSNWITFDCTKEGDYWQLSITDNGIGIRAEYLDKVFNMYFRATEISKGSGLGLFIVKETLRKINGTISVRSELGKYTSFILKVHRE